MTGNGSQSLLDMCLFLFLWETTQFWLCDKPLKKLKFAHVFRRAAKSSRDCSEHSWPWKCRRKAGLPPSWMDQWSTLYRTTPLLCPAWACPGMRERDAIQLKAVREWVPDEKRSMGLLGKGTGNSSYGQTRRGVRWVSGNNRIKEKNKSLYGRKTRRKKPKRRLGLGWAWCWDRAIVESCEAGDRIQ